MTHVVACALCGTNPHAGRNWAQVLAILIPLLLIACAVQYAKEKDAAKRKAAGLPPRPPREPADVSPFTAALLSGQPQSCYTSRYRAVTPAGVTVTGQCCYRGHRSPGLAVAHAEQVAARITRTGR